MSAEREPPPYCFTIPLIATADSECGVCGAKGTTYWVNDPYALGLSQDAEYGQWCAACLDKERA